jgi:uroporphyrinogen-III synthase
MNESSAPVRLWATRPVEQNEAWQTSLAGQIAAASATSTAKAGAEAGLPTQAGSRLTGASVVAVSLLEIEPVHEVDAVQAVKNLILDFDQFDKVVFVSQNAVRETFRWLHDYWPQLPEGIHYFAVGKKTANAVLAEGVAVTAAHDAMNSEELLTLPELQNVWGQKILICRGQGGSPHLGEVLHERGAIVRYCELYQRRLPEDAVARCQTLAPLTERDVVPLFSGETLKNFVTVLEALGISDRIAPVVVPGKRVANMAKEFGFKSIFVADNASAAEMLQAVARCLSKISA